MDLRTGYDMLTFLMCCLICIEICVLSLSLIEVVLAYTPQSDKILTSQVTEGPSNSLTKLAHTAVHMATTMAMVNSMTTGLSTA